MVNVSYIAVKEYEAPVPAYCTLLWTAHQDAQPSIRIRHRESLNPDMEAIDEALHSVQLNIHVINVNNKVI